MKISLEFSPTPKCIVFASPLRAFFFFALDPFKLVKAVMLLELMQKIIFHALLFPSG